MRTPFCTTVFCETLYKILRQTGKPLISLLVHHQNFPETLPLIQLEACALFIEGKTHVILYLLANSNIYRKTPVLQSLSSKVAGVLKDFTKFTIPYPDKFLVDCICILIFPCYILPPYPKIFFCGVLNFFFVLCSQRLGRFHISWDLLYWGT